MSGGVYLLPYRSPEGGRMYCANDAAGQRVLEMTVAPGVDPEPLQQLERLLWVLLDAEAVYPPLKLLR